MRRALPLLIFLASLFAARVEARLPQGILFIDRSGNLMRTRAFPILDNTVNQLTNLLDGKSQQTAWQFDAFSRLTNKLDDLNNPVLRLAYDANDRVTNRWTPAKGNAARTFDAVGNLKTINYQLSPTLNLNYDPLNRLTNMTDTVGTHRFTYSRMGALASEDGPWADDTVSHVFGLAGQLTNSTLMRPGMADWTQTFRYDAAGRMTNTASPAGVFAYAYLGASDLITRLTLGSAGTITNAYDVVARLLSTRLLNSQPSTLNSHAYGYNTAHQRTEQTNFFGNRWSYGYDGIGQLTTALGFEASGTARAQEQLNYGYDKAGNLMGRTNNGFAQVFTNDTRNQLTTINRSGTYTVAGNTIGAATNVTVNGGAATLYADRTYAKAGVMLTNGGNTFTAVAQNAQGQTATDTINLSLPSTINCSYDSNGNLTNDGQRTFVYDDENQLTTNSVAGQWKSEFVYDGLGRRRITRDYAWQTGAWVKTNELRLIYDGRLPVQERGANNQPLVTYTRGLDLSGSLQGAGGIGGLLARTEHGVNGLRHGFYHTDGAGNVTAMIAPDGLLLARYAYDPYGNLIGKWGVWADANVMQFSSKPEHNLSGMIDFGGRWYRKDLQRWLNQDPIGEEGGINLFTFVGNSPMNFVDDWGMQAVPLLRPTPPGLNVNMRPGPPRRMTPAEVLIARDNLMRRPVPANMAWDAPRIPPRVPSAKEMIENWHKSFMNPANNPCPPSGGVYGLFNRETEQMMRSGRSGDMESRRGDHARDPRLGGFDFKPLFRTDNYAEQRGLEQMVHERFNPPLNKINGISPTNPNRHNYINAAEQFIQNQK